MEETPVPSNNKKLLSIGALVFVVIVAIASFFALRIDTGLFGSPPVDEQAQIGAERVEYMGEEGITALDILKEDHEVIEEGGFVTSIDGRLADDGKQEYWAFYVNGQPAQLGASQYVTANSDEIIWKVETY